MTRGARAPLIVLYILQEKVLVFHLGYNYTTTQQFTHCLIKE